MTAVTIELIQAKQTELAALIAQLQAKPVQASTTIYIEEETFDLAPGEHYAGAVLDANGEHMHHLVLMAARPDAEVTWKDALEWAEQAGGALPTRQEQALLFAYYGVDQDPRLGDPMHTATTRDRFGLVTVRGEPYAIVDIGLRMLTPRELYLAQGFPVDYRIDRGADGRPLTKTAQVRMCGNSVCPPLARALVAVNYADQTAERKAA